ncbi:MAG: methyltransferase [Planctomycetaceae bacterium]
MAHTDHTPPDPQPILDLVEGFRRSKVLFAAVELGVFDQLASGPASAAALAADLRCDADALERLLSACVEARLLECHGRQYRNTPATSHYLCQDSDQRVSGYVRYSNNVLWHLWGRLEDAVRAGTHRWKQVFGSSGPIFDQFFATEEQKREFLLGMHGYGCLSSPEVVQAFDLSRFRRLIDLGGATGHLAVAAVQRYPQLEAAVFELPAAAGFTREMLAQAGAADRVAVLEGDFFTDELPTGDLFALGRIIHDWSPERVAHLLARIHDRLPPGGAILLAEKIVWEDKSGPRWALLQSLNMLVCTEGKERTLGEYARLLETAGFESVQGRRTGSPLDAVLAFKHAG